MSLSLRPLNSGPLPTGGASVAMRNGVLTIGRGEENDLTLPDPDRMLSKRHCVLEDRGGDYVILDTSTNGTYLNYGSDPLGGTPTPLNDGDVIQLGSFELVVEIAPRTAAPQTTEPLPPAAEERIVGTFSPGTPDNQDLNDPLADATGAWDDLLGAPAGAPKKGSGGRPNWDRPTIPDDPLATGSGSPTSSFDLGPSRDRGPFLADAPPFGDDPFAMDPTRDAPTASDHTSSERDHFSAPSAHSSIIPDDWDDLLSPATPEAPPPPPPPHPEPPPRPEENARTSVGDPPPPSRTAPSAERAARAFLAGAGAGHLDIPPEEMEATMARLGKVFATMVEGMREILIARASIKSEMRMDRTMITSGGNNPLKFSVSPEQAVEMMIRPNVRGYLDAEAAATEALNDIRAHEVAMMSGMEAALKDLLVRLNPRKLSARIESGSTLGGLLGGKKARYWEAYETHYARIARETEDDFQSTFGREFARAYEDQLKKL